jgi:Golgi apparatus protein 1
MQLSWDCEEQLFRKDMEDSDDIRLSVRFFRKCLPDKKQFCADIPPGHAAAKQCLEQHRKELSAPCKEEVDAMIERRVRDFRCAAAASGGSLLRPAAPARRAGRPAGPGRWAQRSSCCPATCGAGAASPLQRSAVATTPPRPRPPPLSRLDSNLRQVCESDIFNMCSYLGDLDTMDTYDATVINCLQDYNSEIKSDECKAQVGCRAAAALARCSPEPGQARPVPGCSGCPVLLPCPQPPLCCWRWRSARPPRCCC